MLTITAEIIEHSTQKTEPVSFRRLLVYCLLPAALLLLGVPLAQTAMPMSALPHQASVTRAEIQAGCADLQEAQRRAALSTVRHLETAASSANAAPTVTLVDLNRLQNALK